MAALTGLKTQLKIYMQVHHIPMPIFIKPVARHGEIKQKLVDIIRSGMVFSFRDNNISVYNTDYHVSAKFADLIAHEYWAVFQPEMHAHMREVVLASGLNNWDISKYWYQEYRKGDYQPWHTHPGTTLTNVYYLSLPEGSMKTTLNISGVETEFDINEGDIITIPSCVQHCSKMHEGEEPKIVIAFNAEVF